MANDGKILIVFAWAIEIVGVIAGMINSTYTTFGDDLPTSLAGYVPAVPMVVLAMAELGRVPLASVIFHKHKIMQGLAILGILALGYLAVENWAFGFERIVDLRLKSVNSARSELSRAQADVAVLTERRDSAHITGRDKREELRRGVEQRDSSIAALTGQLNKEAEVHQKNLEAIREACRIIRGPCMVPRSQAEDSRYAAEGRRISFELALRRDERKQLQSQIDGLVSGDAGDVGELNRQISIAGTRGAEAGKALGSAVDSNQIYRLAASWYGVNTSDVTAEQFATARWVFSVFSAVAVALIGSIAALLYYAGNRVPGAPSVVGNLRAKVARSRRAYYARRRRPLKIELPGPERIVYREGKEPAIIIEKDREVVRWIDRIVLIPRWGIKAPFYVNSLVNQRGLDDAAEIVSKVTPLKKVN